jgi:predicted Zn-dependent peptidase
MLNKFKLIVIVIQIIIIIILLYITIKMKNKNKKSITKSIDYKSNGKNIKYGQLQNGLKYVLNNTKCGDSITIMLFIRVGSRDESTKLNGISHVLEHMMFQGTPTYPKSQLLHEAIDQYGATFNAYTSLDITCYYITIIPKYVDEALEILSDIYYNSLILKNDLDKEKEVVINEIDKNKSNNKRVVGEEIIKMLMKNTEMIRPIAGSKENVKSFTRNDLMRFLNYYYNPHKVLLSVAGYYNNQNKLLNTMNKFFNIKQNYPTENKIVNYKRQLYPKLYDNPQKYDIKYLKKDIDTSYLTIGFPAFKLNSHNSIVLDLIGTILAGYMSSRLYKILRNELGIIYSISNNIDNLEDCGYYYLMCGTKDIPKCVEVILQEFNNLKNHFVSDNELTRAKKYISGNSKLTMNNSNTLATHYGIHYLYFGKIITIESLLDIINNITKYDIKRVANILFTHDKLKICYMGKHKYKIKKIL